MKRRFCFTLDLKNDAALIGEYKRHHEKVWPEVAQAYKECGIDCMEIYLLGTRMFMIMDVNESFSFEKKAQADASPRLREWEHLMSRFQQVPAQARNGEKWMPMERIFNLDDCVPVEFHPKEAVTDR